VICPTIIQTERIAIGSDDMTTRENDISNVAHALIVFLRAKDPFVAANQTGLGRFKLK
jgi:hypothetical protein